jgi:hypothetical protein
MLIPADCYPSYEAFHTSADACALCFMIAADSKPNLSPGNDDGEEDNAEPSVDERRGAHAEVACA